APKGSESPRVPPPMTLPKGSESPRPRMRLAPPPTRSERRPPRLQRRILPKPVAVGSDSAGAPCLSSPLKTMRGPHRVSGGWWGKLDAAGQSVATARDYYYAEVEDGTIYWMFFDRRRECWFIQGRVD
ncbi:MAG: hypothetical protein AAGE52_41720, partial [Myxococcota bacterium]